MGLLVFFLFVDALLAWYLFREGWVVRSNMSRKYKKRFAFLLAIMLGAIAAWWVRSPWAVWIAGAPAALGILFTVGMGFFMATFKGPWR